MKKLIYVLVVIVFILGGFLSFRAKKAVAPVTEKKPPLVVTPAHGCGIDVNSPLPNAKVAFPLRVTITTTAGQPCGWTLFEGQAGTVVVKTASGTIVANSVLATQGDWMTTAPVTSSAMLALNQVLPAGTPLFITLTEDSPSGEGTPDSLVVPVTLQ